MKIIALVINYQGHDFLNSMIDGIYNYVEKIVFVCSHVSWKGQTDNIGNTVLPRVLEWKRVNDYKDKIVVVTGSWDNQLDHYNYGVKFIQDHYQCDYIQVIDTDEIWSDDNMQEAISILEKDKGVHDSFNCQMYTYVKSPYYRVNPTEPCCPIVFLKSTVKGVTGVRCNRVENRKFLDDVYFHHMCYVRSDDEAIRRKFKSIQVADGNPSHNDWIEKIWNKINFKNLSILKNLHPTKGSEACWKSLIKVNKKDFPVHLQKNPIINLWDERSGEKK